LKAVTYLQQPIFLNKFYNGELKVKIDLLDIETQYVNNRNLNYAKKHYIELKYGIIRLEITYIDKIDSTFIEMESIIAGYKNETWFP